MSQVNPGRTDVGEYAHVGSDVQEPLLRTHRRARVVPLGAAHRAEGEPQARLDLRLR